MYRNNVREIIDRKTDEILNSKCSSKGDMVGVPCWYTTGNTLLDRNWFGKRMLHRFETTSFYIPENYQEILAKIYGDYMTPLPENNRIQYHNYQIIRRD